MQIVERYAHAKMDPTQSMIRQAPERSSGIRAADAIDHYELILGERVGRALEPLVDRLRQHTLSRRGYERLVTLLVENALERGQVDETAAAMKVIQRHWKLCWKRYIPFWPPFAFLRPAPIYLRLKRPGVPHMIADINPEVGHASAWPTVNPDMRP